MDDQEKYFGNKRLKQIEEEIHNMSKGELKLHIKEKADEAYFLSAGTFEPQNHWKLLGILFDLTESIDLVLENDKTNCDGQSETGNNSGE